MRSGIWCGECCGIRCGGTAEQCHAWQERSRWVIRGRLHFCPLSALQALGSFAMGYVMQKNRQEDAEKEPAAEKEHAAAR